MLMADAPAVARDRVIMPQGRGTPVAMLAPELPAGSLAEGEQAVFEVAFTVDLRGRVTTSRLVSSTHATLGDRVVEQHRQWLYAVADRNDDCKVQRFSAVQSIVIARQKGKLRLGVEAAREIALLPTELGLQASEGPLIDNYEAVFRSMSYPREAIVRGEGASFALIVEFGADGKATEVYPVNAFEDDFGFVDAALRAARRFEANQAVAKGRPFAVCLPVSFKVR
jgi:outer membrane biosynthesis protein TonB